MALCFFLCFIPSKNFCVSCLFCSMSDVVEIDCDMSDLESVSSASTLPNFTIQVDFGEDPDPMQDCNNNHYDWNLVQQHWPWFGNTPRLQNLCALVGVHPLVGLGFSNQGRIEPVSTSPTLHYCEDDGEESGFAGIPSVSKVLGINRVHDDFLFTNKMCFDSDYPLIKFVSNPLDNIISTYPVPEEPSASSSPSTSSAQPIWSRVPQEVDRHRTYDRCMMLPTIESIDALHFPTITPFCLMCNVTSHIWRKCSIRLRHCNGRDMTLRLCHRCHQRGHQVRDCPSRYHN